MALHYTQRYLVVQTTPSSLSSPPNSFKAVSLHSDDSLLLLLWAICSISHLNQKETRFIFYFYALGKHSKRLDLMFDPRYDVTIPTKISS